MPRRLLFSLAVPFAICSLLLGQDEPKKAGDLLKEALKSAKEGKKRVLLTFGGPG